MRSAPCNCSPGWWPSGKGAVPPEPREVSARNAVVIYWMTNTLGAWWRPRVGEGHRPAVWAREGKYGSRRRCVRSGRKIRRQAATAHALFLGCRHDGLEALERRAGTDIGPVGQHEAAAGRDRLDALPRRLLDLLVAAVLQEHRVEIPRHARDAAEVCRGDLGGNAISEVRKHVHLQVILQHLVQVRAVAAHVYPAILPAKPVEKRAAVGHAEFLELLGRHDLRRVLRQRERIAGERLALQPPGVLLGRDLALGDLLQEAMAQPRILQDPPVEILRSEEHTS